MNTLQAICSVEPGKGLEAPGHWRGGALDLGAKVKHNERLGRVCLLMGPKPEWKFVQVEFESGEMVLLRGEQTNEIEIA